VSVVVAARNAEATIGDCVASLLRLDYPAERREVVVVDNSSTDDTRAIVSRFPVRLVHESRRGRSHARNAGIEAAHGEVVAFTDADCVVATSWLHELVPALGDESVAGVRGEIAAYPPRTRAQRYAARTRDPHQPTASESARPFVVTANSAFRREALRQVGGFDPAFAGGEDADLSWRLLDAGFELRSAPRAVVFHRGRETAYGLFRQQVLRGYSAALLHRRYELTWDSRRELRMQMELLAALGSLVGTVARFGVGRAEAADVSSSAFDLLRASGRRIGAAYGLAVGHSRLRRHG
jgi:O-antigen biosynthesis protein